MGNADQRPKQVEGGEISSYVAVLDCALDQRINPPRIGPREPS